MYKVIIAEDEMFVRLGIKMSVEWEKLGFSVLADVSNGQQALEVYEMEKPDIIITDIKMPVMDGLTLIRKIREKDERIRFIILSCLEEFQIVREAISLGVTDYVLKLTMTKEDMETVLEKAKKELLIMDKEEKRWPINKEDKRKFGDSLRNYIYYHLEPGTEIRQKIESQFPKEYTCIRMAVLELDHYMQCKKLFQDAYGGIVDASVENILEEILTGENYILLPEKNGRFIIIFGEKKGESDLKEPFGGLLEKIREVLRYYVKTSVSFGISDVRDNWLELNELYHQCVQALEKKFFFGLDRDFLFFIKNPEECKEVIHRKIGKTLQRIGKYEGVEKTLAEAETFFCQHKNPVSIRYFFEHAVNVEICKVLPEGQQRYQIIEKFVTKIKECQTFTEILGVYETCVKYWNEEQEENSGLSRQIREILHYISEHYQEDITLEQVARTVELSRTYVCGLFKKEMGINLTNYITAYRIEKAKELLKSTNLKSYEIAEMVGFLDESYFSRAFKKVTGQSPSSYKKGI